MKHIRKTPNKNDKLAEQPRGEVLVAILPNKADLAILQEKSWYRIPTSYHPKRWPPKWMAFYQPKVFGDDAYQIRYYGEIETIEVVQRYELFPNELQSSKSEKEYFRISLKSLEERQKPIPSFRPRRLVFIPTTWKKFTIADQINDLFDDSPLEDQMWKEFKELQIGAERQWGVLPNDRFYQLDFAIFCTQGQIDIETDGDYWHAQPERIPLDNQRNNDLEAKGWHILRFNSIQISEQMSSYCMGSVQDMINRLGGLTEEGMAPRIFYSKSGGKAQQLSLFEKSGNRYRLEEARDPGIK